MVPAKFTSRGIHIFFQRYRLLRFLISFQWIIYYKLLTFYWVWVCASVYKHVCVCVCVYMYICVYIHTHSPMSPPPTHTHTPHTCTIYTYGRKSCTYLTFVSFLTDERRMPPWWIPPRVAVCRRRYASFHYAGSRINSGPLSRSSNS